MTQASTLDIFLLLARHDDQGPVVEHALDGCSTAREPRPAMPSKRPRSGKDSDLDDLAQYGWGVVAPPGEPGDHLLALIQPLIDLRARQQGREVRIFRSPPSSASDLSLLEAFRLRNTWRDGDPDASDGLPFYLLILGDLQQVPLAVQRALSVSTNHAVGRLSFERDEQYRAYVDKVCRRGLAGAKSARGEIVLHTVKDGTQATGEGHANLAQRLLDGARARNLDAGHPVREISSRLPKPTDELFRMAEKPAYPTVLWSLAHGHGAPRGGWSSSQDQKHYQGALCLGGGECLTADDIANRPFLPGGVWIMHSAFSAGTPLWSSYLGWLEKVAENGDYVDAVGEILASRPMAEQPFVAALPQAALANPVGPLACIGHVDLTWSWGFLEPTYTAGSRTSAMVEMLSALVGGRRIGASMCPLFEYLVQVNSYLVSLYHGDGDTGEALTDERERALWWMVREELAGYVLLGDPATRMAIAPTPDRPVERRATTDTEAEALDRNARLERAVAERILGQPTRIALKRQKVDMAEERFEELVAAYREAGMAAVLDVSTENE